MSTVAINTDWLDGKSDALSSEFTNAIYGKTIVAPSLNQRTDFEKLAVAVTAACSSQHTLSRESLRRLKAQRWEGNFSQLKKVIRLAIANASGTVIREELDQSLETLTPGEGFQPCPLCEGSPVRAEMCVMIQRAWSEASGNVSMVARRLGISRNTVYKHIKGL
ncbi:MAG: helix-turn-helix domain-containing protein [Alphaproteobacteria bacterium]